MRESNRMFSSPVAVAVGALLLIASGTPAAVPSYTDLRHIEPVHGDAVAGAKKATVCAACHGANGESVAPTFPRLAGQRADYLYHRLVSFKRADPKDPYYSVSPMTPNVASLSDTDMRDLATYFSSQTPPTTAAAAAPGEGEALFVAGDSARGIPPCQGCHGAEAGGPSISTGQYAVYPSLRGQYAPYLIARLTSFRKNLPHDTTNDFIMGSVAQTLDDESIQVIAAWLSSLTPSRIPTR
ncbi:MAG TPA: c-type cytochrome [Steroidobacteraceae bacterium]|nr:c-type cytochrome [Steroidobacteraceae bacterium]